MSVGSKVDIADVLENQKTGFEIKGWVWFPGGYVGLTFLLCCLVMLTDGFDNQAINWSAPAIISELGITRAAMTPVFTISIFGYLIGSVLFSMLADRIGRRKTILLAVLVFGVFTLAIPLATDRWELVALRFCASLGIGGGMPMAVAMVSDHFPARARGFYITLLFIGYALGSSGGGFFAAWLIPTFGWRSVFYIGGLAALAVLAILVFVLPESVRYLVLKGAPSERILPIARKIRPAGNYDSSTSFFIQEVSKKGLPLKHLFTEGRAAMTISLWFAMAFAAITHFFMSAWIPTLLAQTPDQVGTAVMTHAIFQAGAFTAFIFGWLLDKKGIPVMILVLVLAVPPVAALGVVEPGTYLSIVLAAISGMLVLGGGIGLNAIAGSVYPTAVRSTGTGAAFGAARIGAMIGPSVAGLLVAADVPVPTIFALMAVPSLIAAVATFMIIKSMTPEIAKLLAAKPAMARSH